MSGAGKSAEISLGGQVGSSLEHQEAVLLSFRKLGFLEDLIIGISTQEVEPGCVFVISVIGWESIGDCARGIVSNNRSVCP